MKKTPSILLAMCIASFFLFSCGGKKAENKTEESSMSTPSGAAGSGDEAKSSNSGSDENKDEAKKGSGSNCDKFLADYEEYINDYIALAKKVKENPQDMSIMSEYSQLAAKASSWASDAKDCSADAAFAAKYAQLSARLAAKAGSL